MRSHRLALFASLCAVSLAGCGDFGFDLDLTKATEGQEGELSFGLDDTELLECLFGCPVDRGFVVGAVGRVHVYGSDPEERIAVRLGDKKDGVVSLVEAFACVSEIDGTSRAVKRGQSCVEGETFEATRSADVVPARAGRIALEVVDADGDVIDTLTLEAEVPAAVATITGSGTVVTRFPGADRLPVSPSTTTDVELAFENAAGERLYFSNFVTGLVSEDPAVANVGPGSTLLQLGPPSFAVTTGEAGTTKLSIDLGGTHFDIPVDLAPAQ